MATYESQLENMKLVALQEGWSPEDYEDQYLEQRRWSEAHYPDASRPRRKYIAEERFWALNFLEKHGGFRGSVFRDLPPTEKQPKERSQSISKRGRSPERSLSRSRPHKKGTRSKCTRSKSSLRYRERIKSESYESEVEEFCRTRPSCSNDELNRHCRPRQRSPSRLRYDDYDYDLTRSSSPPETQLRQYRERSNSPRDARSQLYQGRTIKSYDDIKVETPAIPPKPISALVQTAYKAQATREPLRLRDKEKVVEKMRDRRVWMEKIKEDLLKKCPSHSASNGAEDYPTPESLPESNLNSRVSPGASDSSPQVVNDSEHDPRFETFVPAGNLDDPVALALDTDIFFASKNGRPRFSVLLTQSNAEPAFIGYDSSRLRYLRREFPRLRFRTKNIDEGMLLWVELREKDVAARDSGILGDILISEAEEGILDIAMKLLKCYAEYESENLPELDKFIDKFFAGRYDEVGVYWLLMSYLCET